MLLHTSFIPQQIDSVKKISFDANDIAIPVKENIAQEKTDTTSHKKKKKEKKKKEAKEVAAKRKEKAAEGRRQKAGDDSTSSTQAGSTSSLQEGSIDTFSLLDGHAQQTNTKQQTTPSKSQIKKNVEPVLVKQQFKTYQQADKIHIQNREYWVPSVSLFSLLIIVWARNTHSNRFARIGKAFFNIREFYQVVREEYAMINSLSIAMVILFILNLSVFIYQLNAYYDVFALTPNAFVFFIKIVLFVSLFFLIKLVVVNLLGFMFYGRSEQVADFVYNIFLMNNISGLALIPVIIFMAYFSLVSKPTIILLSCIILISIYLYRILRTFNISIGEGRVSKLYFFAYLCTLEFLPFVVIFKVITNRF
jgi:hypothetical protein